MSPKLELLDREITYASAAEHEMNILKKLAYSSKTREFYAYLFERKREIGALIAHHLGLSKRESCHISSRKEWIRGRFNVCVPVKVKSEDGKLCRNVLIRFPMPHAS